MFIVYDAKLEIISNLKTNKLEIISILTFIIMTVKDRLQKFIAYSNLSNKAFENKCGLGNGFVSKVGDSIRREKLELISNSFPELNIDWIINEKGEMLKPNQTIGDISNSNVSGVNVSGHEIHINPNAYDTLIKIVEANQKSTEKFQEQIDRLITIIENKL